MNRFPSRMGISLLCIGALGAGYLGGRPLLQNIEFAHAEGEVQATRQQLSTVEDLSTVFRHVGKVMQPSVVEIQVKKTIKDSSARNSPDDQLRRFFRDHGGGDMPFIPFGNGDNNNGDNGNGDNPQPEVEMGTGSGVIMEAGNGVGYILTNNHVAGDATDIHVILSDGRKLKGTLLGADAKSDLALVEIKADRLIPARWGDSGDLEKGDWVMAFGAPFGYVGSMTHGIVSALDRRDIGIEGRNAYEDFIQVDAPINPGNSGGPLVNIRGEVIGINTAIATLNGGFQGIGFAIPSNQAKLVYTALKEHGKVERGWLGIAIGNISDYPSGFAASMNYPGTNGVLVQQTFPNTPAYDKLQKGDVITAYNGAPVANADQLRDLVADTPANTKATLKVYRNGKELEVEVVIGQQPDNLAGVLNGEQPSPQAQNTPAAPAEVMGMQLQTLDSDTANRLGVSNIRSGAVVTDVKPNSPAAQADLQTGDVITMVNDTYVHNAQEATDALSKADLKKGIRVYVENREGSRFAFLQEPGADQ